MYDIQTARIRIGLESTDTSKDVELNAAMDASLKFAELYCDRKFMKQFESERFIHFNQCKVQLIRYPVDSVGLVDADDKPNTDWHIDGPDGRITFDGRINAHVLTVDYVGGYEVLPADLEMALWRLFDSAYGLISSTGGTVGTGQVKAIYSAGAKVEFNVSGSGSSGGSGPGGIADAFSSTILDFYKRVYA